MTELDLMWLAGLLEGEGSFLFPAPSEGNTPRIALQMTDEDVVRRAATLMGVETVSRTDRKPGIWKPCFHANLKGKRARALMERLLPHMGARRSQRIKEILAMKPPGNAGENTKKVTDDQVRQIYSRCQVGESTEVIARDYGLSGHTVRQIRARKYRVDALQGAS